MSSEEDIETSTTMNKTKKKKHGKTKKEKTNESKKLISEESKFKLSLNNKRNYICQKRRNTYIISVDENGSILLSIGPDWYYYLCLSTSITAGFLFLFIKFYQFVPLYLFISGIITYFLFIIVYTKLFLCNPGYAESVDISTKRRGIKNYDYCPICNIWIHKNIDARHCKICGMCIEKYDHHCDWIGKCVGRKNINEFYFIMIWVVMVIVYFIIAFVIVHENWFMHQKYLKSIEKMNKNQNK